MQFSINPESSIPKYKQIVDAVVEALSKGVIQPGHKLPSINHFSEDYYLSRDTVEKAYRILRERKIIDSIKGKGYYTTDIEMKKKLRVFFMINKPSTYKMEIYDEFVNSLGAEGHVHMYIYHCDEILFLNELEKNIGRYDYYVIMPHFRDGDMQHVSYTERISDIVKEIPADRIILLDNYKFGNNHKYSSVYQDFENDLYDALIEAKNKLQHYDKLVLVYPSKAHYPYPRRILRGFKRFCQDFNVKYEILEEIYNEMELDQLTAYILLRERDLVSLIKQVRDKKMTLGEDIGILSYNETPLKELFDISVVSTDFKAMGNSAAYMIRKGKQEQVKNVFHYIERKSL